MHLESGIISYRENRSKNFKKNKTMNISFFGLGYVGCVGMGCLAQNGHKVIGIDISSEKIKKINEGMPTIVEAGIDEIIREQHLQGRIRATHDYMEAVRESDISFVCVGTPSTTNGHLNLNYIYQTAEEIGEALKEKNGFHIIVIRSTVFPGTNKAVGKIIEEMSGKTRNVHFAVVSNPEFLREGTAVNDYMNPPLTVIGTDCEKARDIMTELYAPMGAPIETVFIEVAEMIKYVNNSYHALKVAFANEIGRVCKAYGIDSHEVMRIFCMDKQLNISPYYFKPGFAYGGSCLPKDLKALKTMAHDLYVETPVLNAIESSNQHHMENAIEWIQAVGHKKIGVLGLSFKAGTDDMRNSPIIHVIETLYGKGYEIRIYDRSVSLARLIGKNKSVIEEKLPHLNCMLQDDMDSLLDWAETIIISNNDEIFKSVRVRDGQAVIDLVRIKELEKENGYRGICW
jgi:GDP-mannose 6-dehydrogenase